MNATDLYTFGEVMALFVATDTDSVLSARHYELQVVGAEANVAVAVSRLGLRSKFMSRVGVDQLGEVVIDELAREGVDVSAIERTSQPTGTMVRNRGTTQPVEISYLRTFSAGSTLGVDDVIPSDIESSRWIHVTGITVAISETAHAAVVKAMDLARKSDAKLSFDLNIRRKLWSEERAREALRPLAQNVDVLFGGVDEYEVVFGAADPRANLELAAQSAIPHAIMTSGSGVIRILSQGSYWEHEPPTVKALDPVGAGDAFVGGVISGLLAGLDLKYAIDQGSKSGAQVSSHIGDWEGLPRGIGGRRS